MMRPTPQCVGLQARPSRVMRIGFAPRTCQRWPLRVVPFRFVKRASRFVR